MRETILIVVLTVLLVGCSNTKTFTGNVYKIQDQLLTVDCSDEVNHTQDDWGYDCPVQLTSETSLVDHDQQPITVQDLEKTKGYVKVEVTLVSPTNLMENSDDIIAKQVKVINE
ncbi:hypothetical protein [Aquibacillus sediminis]|uniref:hypothetical protein n=1 Tax=Aquibacillus sediminis TaxID=2574734 RepID=UPI001107F80D|nr:hypothetical protein [Aquibacillus sediminis]